MTFVPVGPVFDEGIQRFKEMIGIVVCQEGDRVQAKFDCALECAFIDNRSGCISWGRRDRLFQH